MGNSCRLLTQHGSEHFLHHGLALDVGCHGGCAQKWRLCRSCGLSVILDPISGIQNKVADLISCFECFERGKRQAVVDVYVTS